MSVDSARAFLDVLEKSQLVPSDRLQKLRDGEAEFPDAKSLAVRLVKDSVLTRWQAGALLAGNHKLSIGKYRLLQQLGSGRTGRVYLAKHSEMGRQVALKLLPRRTDASTTNLKQFVDQARAVSALDHPNLIHTFDVDSDAGQFYLIMEHFPGDDLQSVIDRQGPMDYSRAAEIVRQTAEGLAHAAEKGMTHGDVRPSSIAVDGSGRVKLLHLGVVELAGPSLKMLDEKDPSTADFAAPEFTGNNATPASDIYSLGCVFYCLLTGRPPFDEGSFEGRRRAHQNVPPASITVKCSDAPPELAKICQKMMAKTPANRIGSASEAAALLAAWLKKNPLPAPAPAKEERARKSQSAGAAPGAAAAIAEGAATAPVMPSFDFGDKRKSKSLAKTPATRSAAPTPSPAAAEATAAAPQPAPKKTKSTAAKKSGNKRLLIGLGAGGGIALLAIVGAAIAFFAMRGDEAEVAQADTPPSQATGASADELDEGMGEETLDGDLFSSSDSEADMESETAEDESAVARAAADANSEPEATTPAAPASAPVEAAPAAPAVTAVAANAEAQPPAPTAEASPSPAANEPSAAPEKPAEPPAAEAAPTEVAATSAPAEEPAPKAAPNPAPAKTAAPSEPFADFKEDAVALPPLEKGADGAAAPQPVALATVHDDPEAGCFVRMIGGDGAHKGREIFTLEADDPGFRNRIWTIYSGVGESGEKDRVAIAKLSLDEQDRLNFQWTPEAAGENVANYVRNCLVSVNVGTKTKEFALRTPIVVDPPVISLEKANVREQYDIDDAPEPEKLQFEVTSLDVPLPKPTFNPPGATKASAGNVKVLFGEAPNQLLMLEVRTRMPRKFELSVMPFLMAGNQQVRFTPQVLQQAAAAADAQFKQLQFLSTQKQQREAEKQQIEQLLPQQQALALAYAELAGKVTEMKDSASIHFRVFYQVGEHKIELLKTGGAPAAPQAPAAGEAKEPKQRKAAKAE